MAVVAAADLGVAAPAAPLRRENLSASTHAAIGAGSGLVEVTLLHPSVAWKNALQEGRPLPTAPRALYRGFAINAGSFVPITCLQFGVNRGLERALSEAGDGSDLNSAQRVLIAAAAGVATSTLSTPCELVIIQQQRTCAALLPTAASVFRSHGASVFARGALPCALREAIYVGGYLGTAPLASAGLQQLAALEGRPDTALVLGGMASGAAAAVITQPFDTVKTRMQANLSDPRYASTGRALQQLWCVRCFCSPTDCCAQTTPHTSSRRAGRRVGQGCCGQGFCRALGASWLPPSSLVKRRRWPWPAVPVAESVQPSATCRPQMCSGWRLVWSSSRC